MEWIRVVDGNKTYILAIIGGIFAITHFIVNGDFSLSSEIRLSQDTAFLAMIAALRHGIAKVQVGNQGNVTTGGKS